MSEINPESINPLFTDDREPIGGIDVPLYHDEDDYDHGIHLLNTLNALGKEAPPSGEIESDTISGTEVIPYRRGDLSKVPVPEVINITPGLLTGPATPRA